MVQDTPQPETEQVTQPKADSVDTGNVVEKHDWRQKAETAEKDILILVVKLKGW